MRMVSFLSCGTFLLLLIVTLLGLKTVTSLRRTLPRIRELFGLSFSLFVIKALIIFPLFTIDGLPHEQTLSTRMGGCRGMDIFALRTLWCARCFLLVSIANQDPKYQRNDRPRYMNYPRSARSRTYAKVGSFRFGFLLLIFLFHLCLTLKQVHASQFGGMSLLYLRRCQGCRLYSKESPCKRSSKQNTFTGCTFNSPEHYCQSSAC